MNREIKFRAWHNELKEMFWFDVMNGQSSIHGGGYIPMVKWGESLTNKRYRDNEILIDPMNCEIMQFTGLTDKNGVEIYEGDIVKFYGQKSDFAICPVDFEDGRFIFKITEYSHRDISGWRNTEVIGNIHENKELLK